ncbi:unnamed protein product, partial [Didymodactylos carnosus]
SAQLSGALNCYVCQPIGDSISSGTYGTCSSGTDVGTSTSAGSSSSFSCFKIKLSLLVKFHVVPKLLRKATYTNGGVTTTYRGYADPTYCSVSAVFDEFSLTVTSMNCCNNVDLCNDAKILDYQKTVIFTLFIGIALLNMIMF